MALDYNVIVIYLSFGKKLYVFHFFFFWVSFDVRLYVDWTRQKKTNGRREKQDFKENTVDWVIENVWRNSKYGEIGLRNFDSDVYLNIFFSFFFSFF